MVIIYDIPTFEKGKIRCDSMLFAVLETSLFLFRTQDLRSKSRLLTKEK